MFNDLYFVDLVVIGLVLCYIVFFPGFNFNFLGTSQQIGWEEHLGYDPFSVVWDVRP